VDRS